MKQAAQIGVALLALLASFCRIETYHSRGTGALVTEVRGITIRPAWMDDRLALAHQTYQWQGEQFNHIVFVQWADGGWPAPWSVGLENGRPFLRGRWVNRILRER